MATEYKIHGAGIERPMDHGRYTGEESIVLRLQVGKRSKLELIELTNMQALQLATQLLDAATVRLKRQSA